MKWGMPMSFRGPITRGTILTSTVLGLRLVVQAGTLLIVARLLGPADFGAFAGITALAVVLGTLSTFGMQLVLMEEVSRDPAQRDQVLANALPVTLTLGTLLLVLFTTVSIAALGFPGLPFHAIIAIGAADIVVQPLLTFPAWRLTASGQPAASQLLLLFPLSLRLALAAIVFWAAPTDPLGVYGWAYLGASVIALCTVSTTRLSPWLAPRRWQWPGRTRWRKAAGYALVNMTAMAPSELDKTLAARLLPTADCGPSIACRQTTWSGSRWRPSFATGVGRTWPSAWRRPQSDATRPSASEGPKYPPAMADRPCCARGHTIHMMAHRPYPTTDTCMSCVPSSQLSSAGLTRQGAAG